MRIASHRFDIVLLAFVLGLFLGTAGAEAWVAPLGTASLNHLWTADALNHVTSRELLHTVGWRDIATALPVRLSCKLFGVSALAVRLPWILVGAATVALYWVALRRRGGALAASTACLAALTVCGFAPLAVALPLRAVALLLAACFVGIVAADVLNKSSLRTQAAVTTVCLFTLMARGAVEGIGEIHQRHALTVLERTLDGAAAPGETIYVADPMLAAPLWFYGSAEVREQMRFIDTTQRRQADAVDLVVLSESGALPFPASVDSPPVAGPDERIVLAAPTHDLLPPPDIIAVQEHIPWSRLGGFVSPLVLPRTRIFFETSSAPTADVSSKP